MIDRKRVLGIIGGLGPMATVHLLELLVNISNVQVDQEHLNSLVYNLPSIPDRTAYIKGESNEDPRIKMIEALKSMESQGADYVGIPCITAHCFFEELSSSIEIPIINIISETIDYLKREKIKSVGIMATNGTIGIGIFQKYLEENNIKWYIPNEYYQEKVMDIIYKEIKASNYINLDKFNEVSDHLKELGSEKIILGCTELSLINKEYKLDNTYIDLLKILAAKSLLMGDIPIKEEYRQLVMDKEELI